jgi:DUF971 family protein
VETEQRITLPPTAIGLRHIEQTKAGSAGMIAAEIITGKCGPVRYGERSPMPMPEEIVGLLRSKITLTWSDGHVTIYPARDLRLACRCAGCVEEMSGRPLLDPARVPDNVRANAIDLVGQYAISITWSDGHNTGIYRFRELRGNCPCAECATIREQGRLPGA